MTYHIAVANQKGGVAKTTTVVSLAGALVKLGHEVLAVDLDAQANLTLALGADPAQAHGAIDDVLQNAASLVSVSRETYIPGLDLVPANSKMDLAERFLPVRPNYDTILREALNSGAVPETYNYVLMDCPPSMGAVTLNALVASDLLIIPTQSEYFSAHALRAMMSAVKRVRAKHNPHLVYRILITMHDRRNRIHRNLNEQIRATFGDGVFQTMIETDTKLRESSVAGLPISHYYAQSRGSLQYDALAQELIEHVQEKNPSQA
jgi:chromosome partitioning protein